MRILVAVAALVLSLIAVPARAAEWAVGPAPSDDPELMAATVMNDDGHALFLWGRHGASRYQVFVEMHLGRGASFGTTMPSYRIDGGDAVDTDAIRQEGDAVGALWGHVGQTAAFWLAWTSIQDVVLPGDQLHRWFDGREIEITYKTTDGTAHSTRFTLNGAKAAILQATGLKAE
jgi:hypothetical protein